MTANRFYNQIISEALDRPDLLSEWEAEFIDSIADRGDDYEPSEKQKEVLNRIGNKMALG